MSFDSVSKFSKVLQVGFFYQVTPIGQERGCFFGVFEVPEIVKEFFESIGFTKYWVIFDKFIFGNSLLLREVLVFFEESVLVSFERREVGSE